MKQELISNFLIKNSGKFTAEQTIEIQKLLQTTKDDAFPILMTYKAPSSFWKKFLVVFSMLFGIIFFVYLVWNICQILLYLYYDYGELTKLTFYFFIPNPITIISGLVFFSTIIPSIKWYKSGKLKTRKRRMYEEYLKIINAYQVS
ncbi:MAG: hypothetical protein IKU78_01375 [Paludibacteraceae bacterium]|nr:hypothetical protein [Paludibacteraceae bacterium]